ncbi:glutaminyl-tRNA synthase (glutamine-hydrolyzing) subunit B [Candidatus Parcubacteria bacterium 4484_255]|nr:MAG: glutaminyl-tRNA synthase (glutamine-hydrolyzing) subunit B [Candidatus Parcubacteria bacterium 4484_255]
MHLNLKAIIGLEIHLQLNTKSKLFCSCLNNVQDASPNINICPICMGHPGVLPVLNKKAIEKILLLGLALKGRVAENFWFDRKNYFYPDLPKGYQISQYYCPLIVGGYLDIKGQRISLEGIHIEEDTAKLLHSGEDYSLLDFNRAGVPLAEIVTRPEIESPLHAKIFLQELQEIARVLDISSAEMEKGQMRCDVNISLRPENDKQNFYPKTEIKNLNSFRAVEESLKYEIKRQTELWENNKVLKIEVTRGWDAQKGVTIEQRNKEKTKDYRYFKEPDLPIFSIKSKGFPFDIKKLKKSLPELPVERRKRWQKKYGFSEDETKILTAFPARAYFVEKVIEKMHDWIVSREGMDASESEIWQRNKKKIIKLIANWFINYYLVFSQEFNKKELNVSFEDFAKFIVLVYEKKLSNILGRKILKKMFQTGQKADFLLAEFSSQGFIGSDKLEIVIQDIIKNNPDIVAKIKKGHPNAIQFLIGQTVKKTKAQASPGLIKKLLTKFL